MKFLYSRGISGCEAGHQTKLYLQGVALFWVEWQMDIASLPWQEEGQNQESY